jgi:O-antigen/teichoic acid export membrane protein
MSARAGQGIARGALVVAAGSAAAAAAAFLSRLWMARALSPEDLGLLTLGIALVSATAGVAALGTNASAATAVAASRARGELGAARGAARGALLLAVVGGGLAALLLTAGGPLVAQGLGRSGLAPLLARLGPAAWAIAAGTAVLGISRGWGDVAGRAGLRDAGGGLLRLLGVAWGAGLLGALPGASGGTSSIALGWAAGTIAAEVLFATWARARGYWSPAPGAVPALAGQRPYALLAVLVQASQWSDVLLLGALAPSAAVGVYGVARGVARVLEIGAESAGHRFLPAASAGAAAAGAPSLAPLYRRTRALVCALVWPLAAPCLVFPRPLLGRLFGTAYEAGAVPLQLLAAGLLVSVVAGYNDKALLALGRAPLVWRGLASGVAAGAVVTLVLAPRLGAAGAGWGFLAMQVVQNGLWCAWAARAGVAVAGGLPLLLATAGAPVALATLLAARGETPALAAPGLVGAAAAGSALVLLWREVWRR